MNFFGLGAFLDAIGGMGFDYVASGHYANVTHPSEHMDEPSVLELSQDMVPIFFFVARSCLHIWFIGYISILPALFEESLLVILIELFAVTLTSAYCVACLFIKWEIFYKLLISYVVLKFQVKDQTYFLSHLSQSQLKRLLFPLGCIPKVCWD